MGTKDEEFTVTASTGGGKKKRGAKVTSEVAMVSGMLKSMPAKDIVAALADTMSFEAATKFCQAILDGTTDCLIVSVDDLDDLEAKTEEASTTE